MKIMTVINQLKQMHLLQGALLALIWGLFSYVHILAFLDKAEWSYLLLFITETLVAILFLVRSEPVTVSANSTDWALAISATFAPFFFAPADWGVLPQAKLMLVVGASVQIAGLISLNRSFGLVAAKREIKTAGMYKIIRHPLYASYLLTFTGYLLANSSIRNLIVYVTLFTLLFFRLLREEKHLSLDNQYRQYMNRVRYRVIPYIF